MRFFGKLALFLGGIISSSLAFASDTAEYQAPTFNMHRGVTPMSKDIYDLHMTMFSICVVIGILVFSVLIYSLFKHRKSKGAVAATFHENKKLEILWAVIPFIILIVMAVPATIVIFDISNTSDSEISIKVTGYQWKWQYQYLDQGISFYSSLSTPTGQIFNSSIPKDKWYLLEVDNPIVVPIDTKIRFLITANDVIHSWWVPALGIKKDGIPGFVHEAWAEIQKPGTYRGQCAELCGANHGYMPIVVKAVTKPEFAAWVQQQQQAQKQQSATMMNQKMTFAELMKVGQTAYNKYCSACHQVDGKGIPPMYPALRASSVAVGTPISRHIDLVLTGVPGTAMQAFGPQLTDVELAAIITYERNAWENETGDVVQPQDIAAERQKLANQSSTSNTPAPATSNTAQSPAAATTGSTAGKKP